MSRKRRNIIGFLLLFLAWVFIAPLLGNYLIVQKPIEKADAIVILSGSAEFVERTHEAAAIFKKGISPRIFLTDDGLKGGWDKEKRRNPGWTERARWKLIELDVPEEAIEVLPAIVQSTHDEATAIVNAMAVRDIESVVLVTSDYHSRRALRAFELAKQRNRVEITVGIRSVSGLSTSTWWLSGEGWKTIGLELIKTVYYWFRY